MGAELRRRAPVASRIRRILGIFVRTIFLVRRISNRGAVFRKWFATPDARDANWRKILLPFMEGHSRKQREKIRNFPRGTAKRATKWLVKRMLRKTKTLTPGNFDSLAAEEARQVHPVEGVSCGARTKRGVESTHRRTNLPSDTSTKRSWQATTDKFGRRRKDEVWVI